MQAQFRIIHSVSICWPPCHSWDSRTPGVCQEGIAAPVCNRCTPRRKAATSSSTSKSAVAPAAAISCYYRRRCSSSCPPRRKLKLCREVWRMAGLTGQPFSAAAVANHDAGGMRATSKLKSGDGVLIVDHGSRRPQSNAMLHEFVKMYKEETGRQVVEAAHMELASPTIADAFDQCVEQGATRIIVSPYFLFPGRHWDKDIPALAAEAARKHPHVPYLVTAPVGLHKSMVTVIQDRMEHCLSQAAGDVSECDMCKDAGGCKERTSQEAESALTALSTSTPS